MLLRWQWTVSLGVLLLAFITASASGQVPAAPPTSQEVSGAFWRVDHTFQATLRIKNDLATSSLTVRPALFMADGTETTWLKSRFLRAGK